MQINIDNLILSSGSHDGPQDGLCVMEAAAYFAGEPHSDEPECVDPVIGAYLRGLNDRLNDESRQRLRPYITKIIGTRGTAEDEDQRRAMASAFGVKVAAARCDQAKLSELAAELRALPAITPENRREVRETQ